MMFSFSNPQYLPLLLLIPLLWIIHFLSLNIRKRKALKFANFEAISRIEGVDFFSKNFTVLVFSSIIVAALVFSAAGTYMHIEPIRGASFYSFVIGIDSSQSMAANDLTPDRLTVSKDTAINFVNEVPLGTKIAVVSFASFTYIEQELTDNKNDVIQAISSIKLSEMGGTDLYEALITSSNLLSRETNKAFILLSDGQINIGDVDELVNYAVKNDITIQSIAVGTVEGGDMGYSISKLDEETLKNIAYRTGGNYYNAYSKETLSQSFLEILRLTKNKTSINLSLYLLLFALFVFVVEFFLINTRYFDFI